MTKTTVPVTVAEGVSKKTLRMSLSLWNTELQQVNLELAA